MFCHFRCFVLLIFVVAGFFVLFCFCLFRTPPIFYWKLDLVYWASIEVNSLLEGWRIFYIPVPRPAFTSCFPCSWNQKLAYLLTSVFSCPEWSLGDPENFWKIELSLVASAASVCLPHINTVVRRAGEGQSIVSPSSLRLCVRKLRLLEIFLAISPSSFRRNLKVSTFWNQTVALPSTWARFWWTLTRERALVMENTLGMFQVLAHFSSCQGHTAIFLGSCHENLLASLPLNLMKQSFSTLSWPSINLASWNPSHYRLV